MLKEYLDYLQDDTIEEGFLAAAAIGVTLGLAWNLYYYRKVFGHQGVKKAKHKCKKFKTYNEREICYIKERINAKKEYLSNMSTFRSKCKEDKKPDKCNKKLDQIEKKVKKKLAKEEALLSKWTKG